MLQRINGDDMVTIDKLAFEVRVDGKEIHTTPIEFDIIAALVAKRGQVMSRLDLYKVIKPDETFGVYARTIDVHISRLRRKFGKNRGLIKSVLKRGYKFTAKA